MAKRKAKSSRSSKKTDNSLMLLAAAAALIVGFFAVVTYKSPSVLMPTPTPNPVVTVNLDTQNNSYESGTAKLEEVNGKVVVTLSLTGFPVNVTQPAHIHIGNCPNPGAIKYPLTSVVNGVSQTTLSVTMDELKSMGPLALNVHKSVAASSVYYSCGDLKL